MNACFSRRVALPSMTLLFGLIVTFAVLQRQTQLFKEQAMPHGRFTAAQILERTRPLLRRLFPDELEISMRTDKITGGEDPRGQVACKDKAGTDIACFVWDAVTGELNTYLDCRLHPPSPSEPQISPSEAILTTHEWLTMIQSTGSATEWRLKGAPFHTKASWVIHWQSKTLHPALEVDNHSGQLRMYGHHLAAQP